MENLVLNLTLCAMFWKSQNAEPVVKYAVRHTDR